MEANVSQPSPQIAVGFGPVVKFREIYKLFVDGLCSLDANLATPVALGDLLAYSGENTVLPAVTGDGKARAGFALYEAVVNSTGAWGYKPQAGDPIAVMRKGRAYCVNVVGLVTVDQKVMAGSTAGSLVVSDGSEQTVGICRVGNGGVSGGPIEVEIDTTVLQKQS